MNLTSSCGPVHTQTVLSNLLEDIPSDAESAIPVPTIGATELRYFVQYAKYYAEKTPPRYETIGSRVEGWDLSFTKKMPQRDVFNTISAANYLDAEPLLRLLCKVVAEKIIGLTASEIREKFTPL